jgi:hypothetical protein
MKKSRAVPLILLGTLTLLNACKDRGETEYKQQTYASREDCMSDWGRDERDCRPARSGGSGGGAYLGPRYYWLHSGGYPMAVDPDGRTRPLPNSYLTNPGSTSKAISTTSTSGRIGGHYTGGGAQMGGGHTTRGGFGGTAHGMSGGG